MSQATTTGESVAGRILSRADMPTVSTTHGRLNSTYIWICLSGPSPAPDFFPYSDVLYDLASAAPDRGELVLEFCNDHRTGTVDWFAVVHCSTGHLFDCRLEEPDDTRLLCIRQGRHCGHIAQPPAANISILRNSAAVAAVDNCSHNIALRQTTTHPTAAVPDIDLSMIALAGADCSDGETWCWVNCSASNRMFPKDLYGTCLWRKERQCRREVDFPGEDHPLKKIDLRVRIMSGECELVDLMVPDRQITVLS